VPQLHLRTNKRKKERPLDPLSVDDVYFCMRFVETSAFTAGARHLLSDDSYRALQVSLLLRPEQGRLIPGSRGLRKVRWAAEGRGKRGGLRIIYYWAQSRDAVYMLYVYGKQEQGDLTPAQLKMLIQAVQEEFR
jgi:mRNA-degrading endonuclease RelE of RelBE toxin-antitoxin system